MYPTPLPTPQKNGIKYFLGLGLGFIPLFLFMLGFVPPNQGLLFLLALPLYVAVIIAMIVCLSISSVRWIGYGLMTAVFVSPVVAYISCTVIILKAPI